MVELTAIPLSASAVTPSSGNTYAIENLGYAHWLDNAQAVTADGNPILAWYQNSPETTNQMWTYLTYPNTNGETVFTLQALSTVQSDTSFDGRGGYVRVDSTTNKLVQGGAPLAWILEEVAPSIYKFTPFDSDFNSGGKLVATDVNSTISSIADNQVELQIDISSLEQFWTFN